MARGRGMYGTNHFFVIKKTGGGRRKRIEEREMSRREGANAKGPGEGDFRSGGMPAHQGPTHVGQKICPSEPEGHEYLSGIPEP